MTAPIPAEPNVRVRQAQPRDAATIVDFQLAMARETEDLDLDRDTVTAGVRAVFDDPALGTYWVAQEPPGGIVGSLLVTPEWSDWRNGRVGWIQSVYVVPERRGRGIYRCMYQTLQNQVRSDPDLKGLRLYVDRRNEAAHRVYEALGMDSQHYVLYEWLPEG